MEAKALTKNKKEDGVKMSLEFRQGVINGNTNTIKDSVDFDPEKNKVDSLHQFNTKKGEKDSQKPKVENNIYKSALMNQVKGSGIDSPGMQMKQRMNESFDSRDSHSISGSSDGGHEMQDKPRMSRFAGK
jgi:hypothetical protein